MDVKIDTELLLFDLIVQYSSYTFENSAPLVSAEIDVECWNLWISSNWAVFSSNALYMQEFH